MKNYEAGNENTGRMFVALAHRLRYLEGIKNQDNSRMGRIAAAKMAVTIQIGNSNGDSILVEAGCSMPTF